MDPFALFLLIVIILGVVCRVFMFLGNLIAHVCGKVSWMSHLQFFAMAFLVAGTAVVLAWRGAQTSNQWPVLSGIVLLFTFIGMCQTWLSRHRRR